MGVREIPLVYEHRCDVCGMTVQSVTKTRPAHWGDLHILKDAYDYSDIAVADGSVKRLLCRQCLPPIVEAVNAAASAIEAAAAGETPQSGSTEGESATRQGDAHPQPGPSQ